jgi:uncharacterized protein
VIVADASPLIAFARINQLPILHKTLGSIIIPESVAKECTQEHSRPGARVIHEAIQHKTITVHADPATNQFIQLKTSLGQGESAAIALALELNSLLMIDERLARSAAKQLHIKIIGTAGTLLLAKQKNLIPKILPLIHQLKESGYFLSNSLIQEIAKLALEELDDATKRDTF